MTGTRRGDLGSASARQRLRAGTVVPIAFGFVDDGRAPLLVASDRERQPDAFTRPTSPSSRRPAAAAVRRLTVILGLAAGTAFSPTDVLHDGPLGEADDGAPVPDLVDGLGLVIARAVNVFA